MESKQAKKAKAPESQGQGVQVFADNCLVCNHTCYLPSKTDDLDRGRIMELRALFYSVYEIPVPPSFIPSCQDDLPLCTDCTFKLGRLKVLYDQVTSIQKEYVRLKEDIAFNIVDVVAANGGDNFGSMEILTKPQEVIQGYLTHSEVDTLQHIIFDEWHERYSTDFDDDKFNINAYLPSNPSHTNSRYDPPEPPNRFRMKSPLNQFSSQRPPQPKKIRSRQSASTSSMSTATSTRSPSPPAKIPAPSTSTSGAFSKSSKNTMNTVNGGSGGAGKVKPPPKTTVISITTHDNGAPKGPKDSNVQGNKRRREPSGIPEKRAKSIEIMVDEIKKEEEEPMGEEGDMVISMSPGQVNSTGDNYLMNLMDDEDNGFAFGNDESDGALGLEPDVQISRIPSIKQQGQAKQGEGEMDFDGMSLGDLGHFLESTEGGEEEDPERQEYLSNIIQQLSSGGNNIEFQQNEEGLYVCMFCNKTFIHKYPYRDHLKTHTGEGPRCPICNKIFPKNHNLMLHLRTHTGEKPFKCDACGKSFADKSNLKVHYRVHTGEKPYKCQYCQMSFVNSSRLVVHRRLHTGEKPYGCDFCGKSFLTSNQLAAHSKIHGYADLSEAQEGYSQ